MPPVATVAQAQGLVAESAQRNLREQEALRPLSMPATGHFITDLSVQSTQVDLPASATWQGQSTSTVGAAVVALDTDPFGLGERPWLAIVLLFCGFRLGIYPMRVTDDSDCGQSGRAAASPLGPKHGLV